jgi:hypothetical protein
MQIPTKGRIVLYRLTAMNAEDVNRRRAHARQGRDHLANETGEQLHVGNDVIEGEEFPMIIVEAFGDYAEAAVNGQVFLDGNDTLWVTSVVAGDGPGTYAWPERK